MHGQHSLPLRQMNPSNPRSQIPMVPLPPGHRLRRVLGTHNRQRPRRRKGTPYHDGKYQGAAQAVPGKVMCAYYDLGGEGVAYHDSDAKNNGSGALNPANGTYLNEFRMNEGVDTSYTKMGQDPKIDDNPYNKVEPPGNMLYVGWTVAGEWFNVTLNVAEEGDYSADLLYTSNRGGTISLDVGSVQHFV